MCMSDFESLSNHNDTPVEDANILHDDTPIEAVQAPSNAEQIQRTLAAFRRVSILGNVLDKLPPENAARLRRELNTQNQRNNYRWALRRYGGVARTWS